MGNETSKITPQRFCYEAGEANVTRNVSAEVPSQCQQKDLFTQYIRGQQFGARYLTSDRDKGGIQYSYIALHGQRLKYGFLPGPVFMAQLETCTQLGIRNAKTGTENVVPSQCKEENAFTAYADGVVEWQYTASFRQHYPQIASVLAFLHLIPKDLA